MFSHTPMGDQRGRKWPNSCFFLRSPAIWPFLGVFVFVEMTRVVPQHDMGGSQSQDNDLRLKQGHGQRPLLVERRTLWGSEQTRGGDLLAPRMDAQRCGTIPPGYF